MAAREEEEVRLSGDGQRATGSAVKPDNPYNLWAAAILRAARKGAATKRVQADFAARLAARLGVAPFTRQSLSHWEGGQVLVPAAVLLAAIEESGWETPDLFEAAIDQVSLLRALEVRRRAADRSGHERMVEVERAISGDDPSKETPHRTRPPTRRRPRP